MIININLNNSNLINYYDIEKEKSTGEYNICIYQNSITNKQNVFPILKDIIIAKKEITVDTFITKLHKISKCKTSPIRKRFGQTTKQIVRLINSYTNIIGSMRLPMVLSVIYLNGKTLPKIEKMCSIDNNLYFITKCKEKYIMYEINNENIKCMIPLLSIFNLYKKLKRTKYTKKYTKIKSGKKVPYFHSRNISSNTNAIPPLLREEEIAVPIRNQETSSHEPSFSDMYYTLSPNFQLQTVRDDRIEIPRITESVESIVQDDIVELPINEYIGEPIRQNEHTEPIRQNEHAEPVIQDSDVETSYIIEHAEQLGLTRPTSGESLTLEPVMPYSSRESHTNYRDYLTNTHTIGRDTSFAEKVRILKNRLQSAQINNRSDVEMSNIGRHNNSNNSDSD